MMLKWHVLLHMQCKHTEEQLLLQVLHHASPTLCSVLRQGYLLQSIPCMHPPVGFPSP